MTTFDDREKAFETKFAHDAEMMFKAKARRNRLVGEWAAAELGITDEAEVKEYAGTVIAADLEEDGDDDVIRKLHADFEKAGVDFSDHRIEKLLSEKMAVAMEQIMSE